MYGQAPTTTKSQVPGAKLRIFIEEISCSKIILKCLIEDINGALFAKLTSFLHYLLDFSQTLNFGLLGCSNLGARKKVSKSLLSRYLAIYEGSERKPKKNLFFHDF